MVHRYAKLLICGICCFASYTTIAQKADDPQLQQYIDAASKTEDDDEYKAAMKSADSFARKTNNVEGQAVVSQVMGNHYYNSDPDECIQSLNKAYRLFTAAGNKKEATTCLQNIAFAYDEQKKDVPNAMKYTRRAINARREMGDTLGLANMLKYVALLYGKEKDYKKGKMYARQAVDLFNSKNYLSGVAVSYRDLAIVFEGEGEFDSSIAYMLKSKGIWTTVEKDAQVAPFRIYGNNTDLIRINTKAKYMDDAEALVHENEAMDAEKFHYTAVLNFYKEARDFYSRSKDKDNAKAYKEKYSDLRSKLKDEGIKVD